uniref:Uncharacterized protein n=1 Tax=Lotharella oceanica TaxID=641309 RepID=A0A7S2TFE1_9EUKA
MADGKALPDLPDAVTVFVHGLKAPKETGKKNMLDEAAMEMKEEGNKLFRAGPENFDEALKKYSAAIQMCETNPTLSSTLHCNRALLLLHKKEYVEAEEDAKKALQYNPKNAKAYVRAGQACQKTGRMKMAMAYLNAAMDKAETKKAKALAAKIIKQVIKEEEDRLEMLRKNKVPITEAQLQGAGSEHYIDKDGKAKKRFLSTEELKERKRKFDVIVERYGLKYAEPQEAIASYLTSLNGRVATAEDFVKRFPMMSVPEAVDFLSWIQTGLQFKEQVLDRNKKNIGTAEK